MSNNGATTTQGQSIPTALFEKMFGKDDGMPGRDELLSTMQDQSISTSAKQIDARWEEDAESALKRAGFDVIDRAGTCDYQGWGVLMGKAGDEFAVVSWSYGSCGMCDNYEDLSDDARAAEFDGMVERGMTEQEARVKFDSSKGW